MGAEVSRAADRVTIKGPASPKPVGDADMVDMPDAAPTLMAMAPFLPTATHITGLATLRVKECDRIACGANELRKAGVRVEEFDAAMTIHPTDALRPAGFDTYEDHRMAMALSVVASKVGGCVIHGADLRGKDLRRLLGRLRSRVPARRATMKKPSPAFGVNSRLGAPHPP